MSRRHMLVVFAAWLSSPVAQAAQGSYSASVPAPKTAPGFLGDAVNGVKFAAGDAAMTDAEVYERAAALFGDQIPSRSVSYGGQVQLKGWTKPVVHTSEYQESNERESLSVEGMSERVYKTLSTSEVPPPSEVVDAFLQGEAMKEAGLKTYDEQDSMGSGVLGLFKYSQNSPIGIFFNKSMQTVQSWVGNEFAAATDLHESGHARDHAQGVLDPIAVRKGEISAYRTEYHWLKTMDPTGEKLSWARATIGKFAQGPGKAPKFVGDYLEHLAMIRRYGDADDYEGLVVALGYRDRSDNPFHSHGNAEHGNAEVGHGHGSDCDCKNQMLDHEAQPDSSQVATVHYVEYPG